MSGVAVYRDRVGRWTLSYRLGATVRQVELAVSDVADRDEATRAAIDVLREAAAPSGPEPVADVVDLLVGALRRTGRP